MKLPSLVDLMKGAKPFEIKLRFALRGETSRFGLLFEGPNGWGEFAPFAYHSSTHQARWLQAAIEMGWGDLPEPKQSPVTVNAIIPTAAPNEIESLVSSVGARTIKAKFNSKIVEADIALLERISQIISDPVFRIDFNQSLNDSVVNEYLDALADFNIEYLEEPSDDQNLIRLIKNRYPLAIDESIRLQIDATNLNWTTKYDWADYWILKPIPLGGFSRTIKIASSAERPVVISGSFDSSCGLYLTTLTGSWFNDLPVGAATGAWLETDTIKEPLSPKNGLIDVRRVVPDSINPPPEAVIGKLFRQLESAYFELLQLEG